MSQHTPDCHIASEEHQRPHRCRDSGCACTCKEESCTEKCTRNHTHKGFSCEKCAPASEGEKPPVMKNCVKCGVVYNARTGGMIEGKFACLSCWQSVATPPIPEAWEEKFEKMRADRSEFCLQDCHNDTEELKDFIRQELASAFTAGKKAAVCTEWHFQVNPETITDRDKAIFEAGRKAGVEEAMYQVETFDHAVMATKAQQKVVEVVKVNLYAILSSLIK